MTRPGYKDKDKRAAMYGPHLQRWRDMGLLLAFERTEDGWPGYRLTWWDGKISEWPDNAVHAAIVAVDSLERRTATP